MLPLESPRFWGVTLTRVSDPNLTFSERDVLVWGSNEWITNLHYSFQDKTNLYFVMDYYPGKNVIQYESYF